MSEIHQCDVFYRPETDALRFLPEGPMMFNESTLSWVAIQHGSDSSVGSFNMLDLSSMNNRTFELPGRPGFAFPSNRKHTAIVGIERHVSLLNTLDGTVSSQSAEIDADVTGTIINDGTVFDGGLVFGTKDLKFEEAKASLYLFRSPEKGIEFLQGGQTCSNGKEVIRDPEGVYWLLDIDTPTKQLVRYPLLLEEARLGESELVLDLREEEAFPDGMILTPDKKSVIIAFYDPRPQAFGRAIQFGLQSGAIEQEWQTPGSPRVTCPLLFTYDNQTRLLLTTAVEHMPENERAASPQAGSLFVGPTNFGPLPTSSKFSF